MKNYKLRAIVVILTALSLNGLAQPSKPLAAFDVTSYHFAITVTDANDSIHCIATILATARTQPITTLTLNLQNIQPNGKGMKVAEVINNATGKAIAFTHMYNILTLQVPASKLYNIAVIYSGIPSNGFIIGKNKFGERTWFGDNWPNRASCWLPCVDLPADKAAVTWQVTAPTKYNVVANGSNTKQIKNNNGTTNWEFVETNPIPTKVMTIGIAALQKECTYTTQIPICNYYYPQTYATQHNKMKVADEVVTFLSNTIAAYPFAKLNNVQSTTMFGGMENANNIFYDEYTVDAGGSMTALIVHEIAHQWWGNTVTETDYSHLWLSEGFATFFTNYYFEKTVSVDSANKRFAADYKKVAAFLKGNKRPVVDTTSNLMSLLNANSYEKGGLFLQALRKQLGDIVFFKGIQTYYKTYAYKNANTNDFKRIMETLTSKNLSVIFTQWLYSSTLPPMP